MSQETEKFLNVLLAETVEFECFDDLLLSKLLQATTIMSDKRHSHTRYTIEAISKHNLKFIDCGRLIREYPVNSELIIDVSNGTIRNISSKDDNGQ